MYPNDLLEEILRHVDIVDVIRTYIPVEQKGRSYVALCPFHDDKHPSLSISREKQIFKCFVCGAGGNAFSFVSRYEGISFDAAVRKVAEIAGFHDDRLNKQIKEKQVDPNLVPLYRCIDDLSKYYKYCLTTSEAENAREYLKKRNLYEQRDEYGIGYAPLDGKTTIKYLIAKGHSLHSIENIGITLVRSEESASDNNAGRLIFPLHNENGEVIGFSARKIDNDPDKPKYVNSPETPIFHKGDNLFNYYRAKKTTRLDKYVYVLEGFMDVMALERASINSAVAIMGTALTKEQIGLLRKLRAEVRLCLDGDEAGQSGMMRIISPLRKSGIPFRLVNSEKDLRDPDEILQQDGADTLKKKMNNLVDAFSFEMDYYLNVKKLDNADDKQKVIAHFLPILAEKEPGIEKEDYLVKLSKATGYDVEAIRREVNNFAKVESEEDTSTEEVLTESRKSRLQERNIPRKRLYYAERQALHYMVESIEAVDYYENDISHFNDDIHENLANYIADYVDEHAEKVFMPALIASIEGSGDPQADLLIEDLTSIEGEKIYPAYSLSEMRKCHKAINEEKEKMREKSLLDKEISGGASELEKARALEESSRRKYAKLANKKK